MKHYCDRVIEIINALWLLAPDITKTVEKQVIELKKSKYLEKMYYYKLVSFIAVMLYMYIYYVWPILYNIIHY